MSIVSIEDSGGNGEGSGEYAFEDEMFAAEYPAIYEFLSRIRVDGKNRVPSALMVTVEPRRVQLCVMDRHTAQVAFHAANSLTIALMGLNERLQAGTCDWRRDKRQYAKNLRT